MESACLRIPVNQISAARTEEAIKQVSGQNEGQRVSFSLSADFLENTELSARFLLPHTELLKAVNILLAHENIGVVKSIIVDYGAEKNSAYLKDGILTINAASVVGLSAADILGLLTQSLGWDFETTLMKIKEKFPYLLLSDKDFGVLNIILHKRMAGLGDLVFVVNTAQAFHQALPNKKIRLILHNNDDFLLIKTTKLLKNLNTDLAIQEIEGGIEVVNADKLGTECMPAEKERFGIQQNPWYWAQEKLIKDDDVSIVYALDSTPKDAFQNRHYFQAYAGKARTHIFMYELGFSSLVQNPLESGDAHLGFGKDKIGMPPVSPVVKALYSRKYPREDKAIQKRREIIIKSFEGWQELNSALKQKDLDVTVASEWGFLYSYESGTIKRYFDVFKESLEDKAFSGYAATPKTFFIMCGRQDKSVHQEVARIAEAMDYTLFTYSDEKRKIELAHASKDNKVTIILNYSAPRRFFGELFLYSDDLPTVVSGQDNLANILYLNTLSSGRPFFFEALIFQDDIEFSIKQFAGQYVGREEAERFYKLFRLTRQQDAEQKTMFAQPRQYRILFKKIALALDKHKSFIPQTYYLILQQFSKNLKSSDRAEKLTSLLNEIAHNKASRINL